MNTDRERLLRLAEREDGCPIGVGGMPIKVLFLDIDGVLNSASVLAAKGRHDAIDTEMVSRVNRVIEATGCVIVMSSSWRILWPLGELKAILRAHGLRDVIVDKTPRLDRRDNEILAWLKDHPEVTCFAAVDDDTFDMTAIKDRLASTTFQTGIQDSHVTRLIELLNGATS